MIYSTMHSLIIIIGILFCISLVNCKKIKIHNVDCSQQSDCYACFGNYDCAFWYCPTSNQEATNGICANTSEPVKFCQQKWLKLESPDKCESLQLNSTEPQSRRKGKIEIDREVNDEEFTDLTTVSVHKKLSEEDCSKFKTCEDCQKQKGQCVFWYCRNKKTHVWLGPTACEGPRQPGPDPKLCTSQWSRLEVDCPHNGTTTTTTTPSPNTTTTTTKSPETTTSKSTTQSPITPTVGPQPDQKNRKLTAWTIAGITISSILVVLILIGVSYKKVMKIYRSRNPYRTLNE